MKLRGTEMELTNDVWWYTSKYLDEATFGNLMRAFPLLRSFLLQCVDVHEYEMGWMMHIPGAGMYLEKNRTFTASPKMLEWLPTRMTGKMLGPDESRCTLIRALMCGKKETVRLFVDKLSDMHSEFRRIGGGEKSWEDILEHPSILLRTYWERWLHIVFQAGDDILARKMLEYLPRHEQRGDTVCFETFRPNSQRIRVALSMKPPIECITVLG